MFKVFSYILSITIAFTAMGQSKKNQLYTMDDLISLSKTKSFYEYLDHALDIRPAKREKSWQKMTYSMGELLLDHINKKVQVEKSSFERVLQISRWPLFRNKEFFIKKRDLIFIKYISNCYQLKKKNCKTLTKEVYTSFEHPSSFDFDLVAVLAKNDVNNLELSSYISKITQDSLGEFYCSRAPLKRVIIDSLYYKVSKNSSIQLHPDCFAKIEPDFRKYLYSRKLHQRDGAKIILEKFKKISNIEKVAFDITHLLQEKTFSPKVQKKLEKISKNYTTREKLLKLFKEVSPLPDTLFSDYKNKKSLIKTKIFSKNFPEYIDYYAQTCLKHLSSTSYQGENPTPNCHGLFKMNFSINILPPLTVRKYQKVTYFTK